MAKKLHGAGGEKLLKPVLPSLAAGRVRTELVLPTSVEPSV